MSDENNKLIQLAGLGNVSDEDIRKNIEGKPQPVEQEESDVLDLGEMNDYFFKDEDGTLKIDNPYDAQLGVDFDQFKSQGNFLGFNRVTGLDNQFTYTGIEDTFNRSQEAQGSLEKMRNGLAQFVGDTGINVAQGFATLLYGVPSAIANGDFTNIYDNSVSNALDTAQQKYDKYFEIKRGGDQSMLQETTNFLFDDFLGGVSFVVGAIATEAAMTAATVGSFGAAAPAQAAATAGIVARGSRLLKNVVTGGKRVINGQIVGDAVKGFSKLSSTATAANASAALRAAGKQATTRQGLNSAGKLARQMITGAGMEAGMEARHMMNAAGENNKREYEQANGAGSYTPEMEEAFRQEIGSYGDTAFLLNTALVAGSNIIMFPKLFGVGVRKGMQSSKFVDTSKLSSKAREKLAKRLGVEVGELPKMIDAARGTRMGRNLRRVTPGQSVGATMFYEGFVEEGGQGTISRSFEDYIADKYDPANMRDTENMVSSIGKGLAGSYGTSEGLKEVAIGMMLGGLGVPNILMANQYKETGPDGEVTRPAFVGGYSNIRRAQAEQDSRMDRIIRLAEKDGDVLTQTQAEIANSNIQRGLTRAMDVHVNNNDMKRAKDVESDSIFAHATSKIVTGRYEDAIEESREILEGMSIEDMRENLGALALDMTDAEIRQHKTTVHDSYVKRMGEAREAYRQAREVYRGEDRDVHESIAKLLYDVKNRDIREKYLADSIAEKIKTLSGEQVIDASRARQRLKVTDRQLSKLIEIENSLTEEEASPESEERATRIVNLEAEKDALLATLRGSEVDANYDYDITKFNADLEALVEYHQAQEQLGAEVKDWEQSDISEVIGDLREIQEDRQSLIAAYNDLLEPGGYARMTERLRKRVLARFEEEEEDIAVAEDEQVLKDLEEEESKSTQDVQANDSVGERPGVNIDDVGQRPSDGADVLFPDMVPPDDVGAPPTVGDEDLGAPPSSTEDVGPPPARSKNGEDVAPQEPPAAPPAAPTAEEEVQNNAESGKPGTLPGTYSLRVQSDDADMSGEVNKFHKEGSEDLVENGASVGEEVTISRGTIVKDGVAINALEFSLRGNAISRVPATTGENARIYSLLTTPVVGRVQTVERTGMGTRISQRQDLSSVLSTPSQIAEIGFYTKRGGRISFRQLLDPESSPESVTVERPEYKTTQPKTGKPYVYIKDAATGKMVWHPAETKAIGTRMAQAILYIERAHAIVESNGEIKFHGMSLDQATETMRNFEAAYGIDQNLRGKEKAKRIKQTIESFMILDNRDVSTLLDNKADTSDRLMYFPSDYRNVENQPGITLFRKDLNAKGNRIRIRSQYITAPQDETRFVNSLAKMRYNVSLQHVGSQGVFSGMQVNKEGIVEFGEAVTVRKHYGTVLQFTERRPLMVKSQPYSDFIRNIGLDLSQLTEVPTDPAEGPGRGKKLELPSELRDTLDALGIEDLDNLLMGTEFTEGDPMYRAGRLYEVKGLTNKEVSEALNMLTGRLATRMLRHSRTKERNQPMVAADMMRQIRNDLQELLDKGEAVMPQLEGAQAEKLGKMLNAYKQVLDPAKYDQLLQLTFMEAMRISRGVIELRGSSIGEALQNMLDDTSVESKPETSDPEVQENPMAAFDDNFAFGVDPKSTMRLETKLALMTVQYTGKANATNTGMFGKKYVDFNTLTHQLNSTLAGVDYEWSAVKMVLQDALTTYPHFQVVLDLMNAEASTGTYAKRTREVTLMMQKQFVVFAAKDLSIFDALVITGARKDEGSNIQEFSSNARNMEEFAKATAEMRFVDFGFYTAAGTVNTKKVQEFLDKMEKIAEMYPMQHRAAAEAYSVLFAKDLGLRIPGEALTEDNKISNRNGDFLFAGIDTDLLNHGAGNSVFGQFRDGLRDVLNGDVNIAITDPGNENRKAISDFLVATARYQDNFIQNTSKDGSNKLRWHYSAPKHVSKLLKQLVHEPINPNDWTLTNNVLLKRMRIPALRKFVKMSYVDGIKRLGMGQVRDFHGMDMHDKAIARLSYYMNNNSQITISYKGTRKVQLVKHMLPTLADKHTMPLIQVPSLNLPLLQVDPKKANLQNLFDLGEVYNKTLRAGIEMERTRILAIQRGTGDVFDSLTATQKKAKRFTIFPTLDPRLVSDPQALHREAFILYERLLASEYSKMIELLEDSGMVDLEKGVFNYFDPSLENYSAMGAHFGYKASEIDESNKELIFKAFISKYLIEAFDFNLNATTMLVGDPGAFGGATKMGKRFAALIAPGNVIPRVSWQTTIDGAQVKRYNHRVRALVLPDRVVKKAVHEAYLKRIGLNEAELAMYVGYESADGAEYTTAEEHLSILYAQGKITQGKMQKILSKANAGTLSKKEREVFFQPMKPVTVEKMNGHLLYIKSASFPLVAGLTKNTELDKLRVFMEENDIQRAVHTSGLKVGNPLFDKSDERKAGQTMKAVYDDNGDLSMDAVEAFREPTSDPDLKGALRQVIEYDRTSMRIQQEVPSSEMGDKVHGSQVAKLVLANMADDETLFTMNGKPGVTGSEMHQRYMEAREIELKAKVSSFATRYGLTLAEDGTLIQEDGYGQEIAKRLYEEGVKRKYDINELEHLHYDLENGVFSTPLTQGPSAARVESLMLSLLRSEIINPKIYGFGGPIRPETGLRYKTLEEMDSSDISWVTRGGVKLYNGKRLAVSQEGRPNQIIMPWKFKAKIPIVDGVVKAEDLPAEMLQALAYRIPGQKKGSSATFEVVGFMPKSYGDTLIVPEELIGQIGQDYDIDKMYGFLFEPTEVDGKLVVDKDITAEDFNQLDDEGKIRVAHNQMVEIYNESLLTDDPNASLERHRPVTDGYSEELAQVLGTAETAPIVSPFGVFYNDRKADTARSAKKAIGVFASQNVLHSQLEQAIPGEFEFYKVIRDVKGGVVSGFSLGIEIWNDANTPMTDKEQFKYMGLRDIHDTEFLLDYTTPPSAGTRQEQFSVLLNHAVDNENNQLLGMLNINENNWGMWSALTHMGYNMETIALFLNTPYMNALALDKANGAGLINQGGTDEAVTMLEDAKELIAAERKSQEVSSTSQLNGYMALNKVTMLQVIQGKANLTALQKAIFTEQIADAHYKLVLAHGGIMSLQSLMKHDTKNAKTRSALELDLYTGNTFIKYEGLYGDSGLRVTKPSTMGRLRQNTVSGQVFEALFSVRRAVLDLRGDSVYRTAMFDELMQSYGDMAMTGRTNMNAFQAGTALNSYLSEVRRYLNAKWVTEITGKNIAQVRKEMTGEGTGMAARLVNLRASNEEVRDNLFIKQLIPMVNPKEGYSRIEFTGDRVINVSPIEMHGAFLALARSEDVQVRQLAEDLVVYSLLNGGAVGSRSYNKYIPAAMLQQLGIRDALGTSGVEYMSFDAGSIMHEQIIRHNPDLAPRISSEYESESFSEKDAIVKTAASVDVIAFGYVNYKNRLYKIANSPYLNVEGNEYYAITEVQDLGDYFSAEYAPDTKDYTKTLDIKQQNEGNSLMPPMAAPIQGYDNFDLPPSMVDDEIGSPVERTRPGASAEVESEVEDTSGPNAANIGDVGAPPVSGRPGRPIASVDQGEPELRKTYTASEYATKFVKGSSNVLRQLLDFEARMGSEQKVKIVIIEPSDAKGAKANYRNDGKHILYITKGKGNKGVLTSQELAHELIHAHTVQAMDNPPAAVKETVERLDNLRKQITESPELLRLMGLDIADYNLFVSGVKVFKRVASGESLDSLNASDREAYDFAIQEQNQKNYYGLFNAKEFIAEAMSNPEFQKGLNNIKLSKNETFLDRVVSYFSQMLLDLGIIADSQTALEEVAALTMNVIVQNAKQRGVSIKKSKKASDNRSSEDIDNMLLDTDVANAQLTDNTLQAFVDYKDKRIRELKEMRSRYRGNKALVQRMNQRIGLEERDLELLADDSVGLQDLVAVADRELQDARAVLESASESQQDMRFVQSALENVSTITEFYANMRGIAKEGKDARASIDGMVREASILREDYFEQARELSRKMARKHYKGTKGIDYINNDTFERIDDPGTLSSTFLDATRQGSMELNFLDGVMRDAAADQKAHFNRRALRFMKRSKAFQQTAYFKKHKWEGMVQKDSKGNPTPQLINALSGKWEQELASAQRKYRKQPKLMRAWLAENTDRIDVNTLYDYSGDTSVRKNNPAAIALLEKQYGKLGAEEFLQRQDQLMENYVYSRTAQFDIIETTVEGAEERKAAKEAWVEKNDPSNRSVFNRFLFNMPKKAKGGKSTGYYDTRFIALQKDAAAVEFYREYRQQMTELMRMLPMHKMGDAASQAQMQNGLFIPAIRKSLTSEIIEGGLDQVGGRMTDAMLKAMTVTEEDNMSYLVDPVTGRQREELPVMFTNKLADASKQEYNMEKTFLAFTMMATTYESKNKIEDTVRMTRTLMGNINVTPKVGMAKLRNKLGMPLSSRTADDRKNIMNSVNTLVDRYYGHKTTKDVQKNAPRRMWPKDVREEIEKLEKVMAQADTLEEKQEIQNKIDAKTPKLSVAKAGYGVQQWVQAKGMGWNLPAATTNMVYGTLAGMQYAAGQREFNENHYRRGLGLMMNSMMNSLTLNYAPNKTAKKIQGMMSTLDVLKDFTEMRFQPGKFVKSSSEAGLGARGRKGLRKLLGIYELQRSSEYVVYGSATIALLQAEVVDGKSLWEHMDENGVIQLDGYRPGEAKHKALIAKVDQINKRIHGNYDPNSPMPIKSTMIGPLLMQFKSWLPEAVAQRVQSERYDPLLDRNVKGRWNTMMQMPFKSIKAILPRMIPILNRKMQFDDTLSETDQENLRKSAANFRQMMYLYIFVKVLENMLDDDDDDKGLNFMLNIANRVDNDLNTFRKPAAFSRLIAGANSLAVLGLFTDLQKFAEATGQSLAGDDTIPTGVYAGKYRMLHHGGKLIPHSAAIQKLANNIDRIMTLR